MHKPLICLTNDSDSCQHTGRPRRIVSPKAYACAIASAGGIPLLTSEYCADELAALADGLILSGGDDLEPELFGSTKKYDCEELDTERSAFEIPRARAFVAANKPIFGICRGIQLINVILGGSIYQDLSSECGLDHKTPDSYHAIHIENGSVLHRLFGSSCTVNSIHHQALRDLAPGLRVTATATDGVIEAIEHVSKPIIAVQFHPEQMLNDDSMGSRPNFSRLFSYFIDLVREHSTK